MIIELNYGKIEYEDVNHASLNLDINNLSLNKISRLSKEQDLLLNGLEGNMKLFQEFLKLEKEWKDKQESLLGDLSGKNLDTINYYIKEIERCENDFIVDVDKLKMIELIHQLKYTKRKSKLLISICH